MTGISTELIEALLKHLSDRLALAILLASLLCFLLMLGPWAPSLWMREHWMWPFLGGLLAGCYLPTRFILANTSEFYSHRRRVKRLHSLTNEEKQILRGFIKDDSRTSWFRDDNAVARGLADDSVLYIPSVNTNQFNEIAYNIQDWARLHLKKNPELLINSNWPTTGKSSESLANCSLFISFDSFKPEISKSLRALFFPQNPPTHSSNSVKPR